MLRSIELWDFESHEHTLIDDLSAALNAFVGDSNVGKTSIVRALMLVAYNEFDPDSVRVGARRCKVKVVTDKGSVKVTRGPKDNLWEIKRPGQPDLELDKVGRVAAPPQAGEVVGLSMVKLGDVNVPVNIMDQLESHFMLSGIGDKTATGSVRAQIVDEISGLSGIEGVIKGVSLDNTRNGRELKRLEKQVDETSAKMYDEDVLDRESRILGTARDSLEEQYEALKASDVCQQFSDEWDRACSAARDVESELAAIPDIDRAERLTQEAVDFIGASRDAVYMCEQAETVKLQMRDCMVALNAIPDIDRATTEMDRCLEARANSISLAAVERDHKACETEERECLDKLELVAGADRAVPFLEGAQEALASSRALQDIMMSELEVDTDISTLERKMRNADTRLADAIHERDKILKSIKVCPLTLLPLSEECLKGIGV